eukprot:8436443-Alexandrium_andersonii.AAC.1
MSPPCSLAPKQATPSMPPHDTTSVHSSLSETTLHQKPTAAKSAPPTKASSQATTASRALAGLSQHVDWARRRKNGLRP